MHGWRPYGSGKAHSVRSENELSGAVTRFPRPHQISSKHYSTADVATAAAAAAAIEQNNLMVDSD